MSKSDSTDETYSDDETRKRAAATLKVMLATPHKPHKDKKAKA